MTIESNNLNGWALFYMSSFFFLFHLFFSHSLSFFKKAFCFVLY